MKVKDLIKELQNVDSEMEVHTSLGSGTTNRILHFKKMEVLKYPGGPEEPPVEQEVFVVLGTGELCLDKKIVQAMEE